MTDNLADKTVLTSTDGAVCRITFNRPERLNAISFELVTAFHDAVKTAVDDPRVRVIVLTGAGSSFCSGDDLDEFQGEAMDMDAMRRGVALVQDITRLLMFSDKLSIAAVQGWAVGGGFEWALNCDFVLAADTARFFMPEIGLGLFVTGGATALVPMLAGRLQANRLMLHGDRFDAAEALKLGLVSRVVSAQELAAEVAHLCDDLAALPEEAVAAFKRVRDDLTRAQIEEALVLEEREMVRAFERSRPA